MSQPFDNITGWEIQPYVPKVSDSLDQEEEAALHAKLYKLLRQTVSKSASKLKSLSPSKNSSTSNEIVEAVPLSFKVPEDNHVNTMRLEMLIAEAQRQRRRRTRTSLVGEISVSFKLPEDFVMTGMDMNKMTKPQDRHKMSATNYKDGCQFSLKERLEGWKVERRQRSNGRYDLYYRHEKSKASFRSTIEVVNFLLYEALSDKQGSPNDRKSEENSPIEKRDAIKKSSSVKRKFSSTLNSGSPKKTKDQRVDIIGCENKRSSSMKENWSDLNLGISPWNTKESTTMSFSSRGCEVNKVETVEELISNNNNVLHSTTSTSISQSDGDSNEEFKEYSTAEFSSESIDDDKGITPRMVKQFLESAYNNLLNYFNKEVEAPKVIVDQTTPTVNVAKVEADPTAEVVANASSVQVEANKGRSLVVLPSYNEQCDLINHIPWADMLELISRDNNRNIGAYIRKNYEPYKFIMTKHTALRSWTHSQKPSDEDDQRYESTFENQESMVHFVQGTIYGLPKEWVVEERPRTSLKYYGKIDQFFYEPNTGKRFRSLKSAQKHIKMGAIIENHEQTPADESSQLLDEHFKAFPKNKKKKKESVSFDFENPPECVKWVLNDVEDDKWSPCICNTVVPDDVKCHWAETFASINCWN